MLARRAAMAVRNFATTTAQQGPKGESEFRRIWMKEQAAYPIIVITGLAITMATYKIFHTTRNPDYHFSRYERRTLDFIENDKDVKKIQDFSENTIHKVPEFIKTLGKAKGYIKDHN